MRKKLPGHALGRAKITNRRAFVCYTAVGIKSKTPNTNYPRYLRGYIPEEFTDQNFNNRTLLYNINIIFSRIQWRHILAELRGGKLSSLFTLISLHKLLLLVNFRIIPLEKHAS